MENNIYRFDITIYFNDKTKTTLYTYDDNKGAINVMYNKNNCYIILKNNAELLLCGKSIFPVKENIKEISMFCEKVNDES